MIKVLAVAQGLVGRTVADQINRCPEVVCLALSLEAGAVRKLVKKGHRVLIVGSGADADVRIAVENLSSLGITIQQVMQSMNAPRCLVVEGLSTLALKLPSDSVRRFALFLAARLKASGVDTVFVVAKDADAGTVLPVLMQAADEVISGKGQ